MPTITLFGPSGAPFVLKVRGALALKRLPYRLCEPKSPEDFRRFSPVTGLLPAIEVDGVHVHDSAAILDHLDARFPEPPLLAPDPKAATSQRRLEVWAEATFVFYWQSYLRALVEGPPADDGASRRLRVRRRRRPPPAGGRGEGGLGGEFRQRLDDLVNFLGDRPFFYAERVSRADLTVYSFLARLPDTLVDRAVGEIEARPALWAYLARVEEATPGLAELLPPPGTPLGGPARVDPAPWERAR